MRSAELVPYLQSITGTRVLTGQELPEDGRRPSPTDLLRLPEAPAMLGANINVGRDDYRGYDSSVQTILADHARKGGVVVLCMHPPSPTSSLQRIDRAWVADQGAAKPDLWRLLREGTTEHDLYLGWIDRIIRYIKTLPADCPVIFRPWHEAGGLHFWWGRNRLDPAGSEVAVKALWEDTMRQVKAVCPNVLGAFSGAMAWYSKIRYGLPDLKLVDLVGASLYSENVTFADKFGDDYADLVAAGKPVFLFELGSQSVLPSWDARRILDALKNRYPRIVGFVCWQDNYAINKIFRGLDLLSDWRSVNLTDLPKATPIQTPVGAVWAERDPGVRLTATQTATAIVKIPVWPS